MNIAAEQTKTNQSRRKANSRYLVIDCPIKEQIASLNMWHLPDHQFWQLICDTNTLLGSIEGLVPEYTFHVFLSFIVHV